jgi:hypothetical protein
MGVASQTITVLSALPVRTRELSGLNDADVTTAV